MCLVSKKMMSWTERDPTVGDSHLSMLVVAGGAGNPAHSSDATSAVINIPN